MKIVWKQFSILRKNAHKNVGTIYSTGRKFWIKTEHFCPLVSFLIFNCLDSEQQSGEYGSNFGSWSTRYCLQLCFGLDSHFLLLSVGYFIYISHQRLWQKGNFSWTYVDHTVCCLLLRLNNFRQTNSQLTFLLTSASLN